MKKVLLSTFLMFQALVAADVYATFDVVSEKSSETGSFDLGCCWYAQCGCGRSCEKGDLLLSLYNAEEKMSMK